MKKLYIIIIVIILAVAAYFIGANLFKGEDAWVCRDGVWVKQGNPSTPAPTTGCGQTSNGNQESEIIVDTPKANQVVFSPIELTGQARGSWFFEANAPVKLIKENGEQIAVSRIEPMGEWMTTEFVPYRGLVQFEITATTSAILVMQNDNPSGLPENAKELRIPLTLVPAATAAVETMTVEAYFNNNYLDPQITCNKVFVVKREVPKTQAVARAALEELLKGPTEQEKTDGYMTNINPGVKIQSLTIQEGVAKVDFDKTLEQAVGGSCRVLAIRSQITRTLEQFPTVEQVIISIDGRTEDILQP